MSSFPFDGRGFILKGFVTKLAYDTGTQQHYTTLFRINHGTIKNIAIKDFTLGGDFVDTRNHGLLVYTNTASGRIEDCNSYGNITMSSEKFIYMGVFAFESIGSSTITNCTNSINVLLSGNGATLLGGIVQNIYHTTTISYNTNNGNLQSTQRTGGIVSYSNTATATIQGNISYGILTTNNTSDSYVGGIIGFLVNTTTPTIENNINYGTITSNSSTRPACGIASGYEQNTVFTHGAVKDPKWRIEN